MKKQNHRLSQSHHFTFVSFFSFLTLTLILALFATLAHSADVTLAWDPNTESDLAGYKLYYKTGSSGPPYNDTEAHEGDSPITLTINNPGDPYNLDDSQNPEYTLTGLDEDKVYFFVVTAYDTEALESGYSNEVSASGTGAPSVTSITSTNDDRYYKAGDTLNITINFSEAITLAGGNLTVSLDTAGTAVIGAFDSQTTASGTYTVQAGDNSTDLNVASLTLSGGTLQSSEGTDCDLSLPTGSNLANNKDIVIDTVAPSSSATAPSSGNGALSITWTASDATSGVASTQLWYKKGSGGTWTDTGLTAQTGTSGTFSYTPPDGDGTCYFATRSTDNAGNVEAEPSGDGDDSTIYDTIPPSAPTVSGTTPTDDTTPTWSWSSGGGGNGTYRYKLDNSTLSSGATQTTANNYTPSSALSEESHTLYVQERDGAGNWSGSGSFIIVIDTAKPSDPIITTDGGNGQGSDYVATDSSITLQGTCAADTTAIYVNGSADGVTYTAGGTSWTYTGTLQSGDNTFAITAEDAAGNLSDAGSITVTYGSPIGGYINDHVIPAAQISQSTDGDGIVTIRFKIEDPTNDPCTLHTLQYSVDGGNAWNAPTNGDSSQSLSSGWQDNDGVNYSSAADFDSAEEYSLTFTTKHHDVTGFDGEDQSDNQVRFTVNDGTYDSLSPVTSENFRVDNTAPTIQSYPTIDHDNNTIDITFSETDMQNVTDEANYRFSPSLNFATPLVDGDDITNPSGTTYHLTMASIPDHTIFTLTANNITDAEGNPVTPSSVRINDNDNDDIADDWEITNGVDDPDEDLDGDGLNTLQEYTNSTDPNNADTDGDELPDGWEVIYGLDPNDNTGVNGRNADFDGDGWTNYEEYIAGINPADDTSYPAISLPEIVETIPHHNAGLNGDTTRVPNDASFCVWIEDSDGIDITDLESITFTISDGVYEAYTRDLSNETVVRVVKLTEEDDTQVTRLWAVYDRSKDDDYGNSYAFDSIITIGVNAKNRRGVLIEPVPSYTFRIESETQHDYAQDPVNLPDTAEVASDDPDLEDPDYVYDAGVQVLSGDLEGAKIIYNSSDPVTPRLGPTDEIPSLPGRRSAPMNLQPPTVFNTPVKIFIPYPRRDDVSHLHVYLYKDTRWVRAFDNKGEVRPDGEGWVVPGSRVDHSNGNPSTVEIKVYHFSAVQAGIPTSGDVSTPATDPADTDTATVSSVEAGGATASSVEAGGGCFIGTATFGPNMDWHVEILSLFRDVYLLPTKVGHVFVDIYYRYSPRPGLQ